jgi:hypothetical protein
MINLFQFVNWIRKCSRLSRIDSFSHLFYFISFHFISFHFISFHFISLVVNRIIRQPLSVNVEKHIIYRLFTEFKDLSVECSIWSTNFSSLVVNWILRLVFQMLKIERACISVFRFFIECKSLSVECLWLTTSLFNFIGLSNKNFQRLFECLVMTCSVNIRLMDFRWLNTGTSLFA